MRSQALGMLLSPHHHDAIMPQRPRAVGADVKPFFLTIVQIAEAEMQIANATARDAALAGNRTVPLKEFVQRVYQRANIAAHVSLMAFSAMSVLLAMPLPVPGGGVFRMMLMMLMMRMLDVRGRRRISCPTLASSRRSLRRRIVFGVVGWALWLWRIMSSRSRK
jgi:hypothetical protein